MIHNKYQAFYLQDLEFIMKHTVLQVRCTTREPLELQRDHLASKSGDLYIFWQNYSQLYHGYNQKWSLIQRLQQEIDATRTQSTKNKVVLPSPEQIFYKEPYQHMQRSADQYKTELKYQLIQVQQLNTDLKQVKKENQEYHDKNRQLQIIIQELRNENAIQKKNVQKILQQLKIPQSEIGIMTRVQDQLGQKDMILNRCMDKQKQLMQQLENQDAQIDQLRNKLKEDKVEYERILKQSLLNSKTKVICSLPALVQTSKQSTQMTTS